jgi:hypothetical protein
MRREIPRIFTCESFERVQFCQHIITPISNNLLSKCGFLPLEVVGKLSKNSWWNIVW